MKFLLIFYLLIIFFIPTIGYTDQGVKISCVNMSNLLDKNPVIERFKFDVTSFQYYNSKIKSFIEIPNKNLTIGRNFFSVKLSEYELDFEINYFEDNKNSIMSMSKYDYINNKFLDYLCDVQVENIE